MNTGPAAARALLALSALASTSAAAADPLPAPAPVAQVPVGQAPVSFELLPGASREISHAASASRDTAALGLVFLPRVILTGGGDFGLAKIRGSGLAFRPGFFGMLELESKHDTAHFLPLPGGDVSLWRGLYGYSAAIAFEQLARRWMGERGALEATLSFRHESEHFTGSNSGPSTTEYTDLPHIGDFLMLDVAARVPLGRVDIETRVHYKAFFIHDPSDPRAPYRHAAGTDVIVRVRAWERAHLFTSSFAEFIAATGPAEDAFFFRNLTGVILPGRAGDMYVFMTADVGHGKGFLVHRKEASLGAGVRVALE